MANPVKAKLNGHGQISYGFVDENAALSGLGLNTFGFLWGCPDIWAPCDDPDRVTTWTDCTNITESTCD